MHIALALLVGLLIVYLLAYADFVLSRKIKKQVIEINAHSQHFYGYRPFTPAKVAALSLLFWLVPSFLISPQLHLEYRLALTIMAWSLLALVAHYYLKRRTSTQTARQASPLLLAAAIIAGILLWPLLSALRRLLINLTL